MANESTAIGGMTQAGIEPAWWTITQAAAYCQCGEKLIYRAVRKREIEHVKLNGRGDLRFRKSYLDAWLESKAQPIHPVPVR